MAVENRDVARVLEAIASLLELDEASPFRVRAYRAAADEVAAQPEPIADWVAGGRDLTELQGVGKALASLIEEVVEVGAEAYLANLEQENTPGVFRLMRIPGLGPKRVRAIRDVLGDCRPEVVRDAAEQGRLRDLPGFGEKTEANVLRRIRRSLGEDV